MSKIASTALVVGWGLCGHVRALPQRARRRLILLLLSLLVFTVGVLIRVTTLSDIAVALAVELVATCFTNRGALKWANDRGPDLREAAASRWASACAVRRSSRRL